MDKLQVENKRLRDLLYELANYVSVHIRHTDPALSSLVSEAILASYDPSEDEDESTTWTEGSKRQAAL